MIRTHVLGYPRVGGQRELPQATEQCCSGEIDDSRLQAVGAHLRARNWQAQCDAALDFVTVGDFSCCDHVADHIQLFGCEPARFGFSGAKSELARYFAMTRGTAGAHARSAAALQAARWFDTNYHYLVPEFSARTTFRVASRRLLDEVAEAQALGHAVKPVLVGPLTFLWLGKTRGSAFERLDLLEALLPAYGELLAQLAAQGVTWVQIDEPILGLDLPGAWKLAFERAYHRLQTPGLSLLLATYFSSLEDHLSLACKLPVAGLHVDAVSAPQELAAALDWMPLEKVVSVGIVSGRNVWRTDLDRALRVLRGAVERRNGRLWIASSCSLMHVPVSLAHDQGLDTEVRGWLAGADEKLAELALLKRALLEGDAAVADELAAARAVIAARAASPRVRNPAVAGRIAGLPAGTDRRHAPFTVRQRLQHEALRLPLFPTTTIGSFPQTAAIRAARAAHRRGELSEDDYRAAMRAEIAHAVRQQEALGLDVLVHGEAERNDMVEYFGEQLAGFAFTANGWVQSYGSRCVKPPVLYGDVSRPRPMTVDWTEYAQSLTARPMKGMLTGPVTILQWSFVRDDQPRADTALQIALAMRDEVVDLEAAGIGIIQIDEPAIREGLPLRRAQWSAYLRWAARAFRIAASGVGDATQIHTHMCYAEFNDILPEIASMDADVITIETSRSDMELLRGFGHFRYPNEIGPGVYDIHSPRIPSTEEIVRLLKKATRVISADRLWVTPGSGIETRQWLETREALSNMVAAARRLREDVSAALARAARAFEETVTAQLP